MAYMPPFGMEGMDAPLGSFNYPFVQPGDTFTSQSGNNYFANHSVHPQSLDSRSINPQSLNLQQLHEPQSFAAHLAAQSNTAVPTPEAGDHLNFDLQTRLLPQQHPENVVAPSVAAPPAITGLDGAHDPAPSIVEANGDSTMAKNAAAPTVRETIERVNSAMPYGGIAERLKTLRRSSTRQVGPVDIAPPTPASNGSETPASMSQPAKRAIKRAAGAAKGATTPKKGHNGTTPKDRLKQTPKAIKARAYRAEQAVLAGRQPGHLPSPAVSTATAMTDTQRRVAGEFSRSLGLANSAPPVVTPAKRGAAYSDGETRASKRLRAASTPGHLDSTSETMEASREATPDADMADVEQAVNAKTTQAISLEKIRKYSKPGENLNWITEKDTTKRQQMQSEIKRRQLQEARDTKRAEEERKKQQQTVRQRRPSVEQPQVEQSTKGASSRLSQPQKQLAPPPPASSTVPGPLPHTPSSASGSDFQGALYLDHKFELVGARELSETSLAAIQRYSNPGEDLNWTTVDDPAQRVSRRTTVTNRRSYMSRYGKAWLPGGHSSNKPARMEGAEQERLDQAYKLEPLNAEELSEATLELIKRYSNPGEDLDWTKVQDPRERDSRRKAVTNRRSNSSRHGKVWAPSTRKVPHPKTGRAVSASSLADIDKYSRDGEDLDWTKVKDAKKRRQLQDRIAALKALDPEVSMAPKSKKGKSSSKTRHIDPQSLADISKYSTEAQDLDWTKVDDQKQRQALQSIIRNKKRSDPSAVRIRAPYKPRKTVGTNGLLGDETDAETDAEDSDAVVDEHAEEDDADDEEMEDADIEEADAADQARVLTVTDSRGRPINAQSAADIAKYTREGENLDWLKCNDRDERRRMQNILATRKARDPDAVKIHSVTRKLRKVTAAASTTHVDDEPEQTQVEDEGNAEDEDIAAGQASGGHIAMDPRGRPINQQSLADIVKYTRSGEDLDWTKVTDSVERVRLQNLISGRKKNDRSRVLIKKRLGGKAHGLRSTPADDQDGSVLDEDADAAADESDENGHSDNSEGSDEVMDGRPVTRDAAFSDRPDLLDIDFRDDSFGDDDFVESLKRILVTKSRGRSGFYAKQCSRILTLLNTATPPVSGEALFLATGEQAARYLAPNHYFPGPMFLQGQQPMPLVTQEQFLAEQYLDSVKVMVQDPAMKVTKKEPHVRSVRMGEVKARFAKPVEGMPWNMLELAAHREDGLRPAFLNNEDCSLLMKLKLPSSGQAAGRPGYTEGFKEIEKWTLCAQAGALTEPHQDSHGYSTYITVNEGTVGFGWLSNPTAEERKAWAASHDGFIGGRWRYVLMRAGTTVYFPAGTVHFVFRHPDAGNTLAFGGHVLRCSQIVRWINVLLDEQMQPNITNEDLSVSAPGYLNRVEKFVRQAQKTGKEEMWGGKEDVEEFLRLKKLFTAQAAEIAKNLK